MIKEMPEQAGFSYLPKEFKERVEISKYIPRESLPKGFKRIQKIVPFINYSKIRQILDFKTNNSSFWIRNKSSTGMQKKSIEKLSYSKYLSPSRNQRILPRIKEKSNKSLFETTQERFFISSSIEDYDSSKLNIKPNESINRKIIFSTINIPNKQLN